MLLVPHQFYAGPMRAVMAGNQHGCWTCKHTALQPQEQDNLISDNNLRPNALYAMNKLCYSLVKLFSCSCLKHEQLNYFSWLFPCFKRFIRRWNAWVTVWYLPATSKYLILLMLFGFVNQTMTVTCSYLCYVRKKKNKQCNRWYMFMFIVRLQAACFNNQSDNRLCISSHINIFSWQ